MTRVFIRAILRSRYLKIIVMIAISFGIWSCRDEVSEDIGPVGVIEGWMDSDGYPVVIFTQSINPEVSGEISQAVIKWGTVRISDGEEECILTGGPSNSYFPPYRYYTYDMKGEPGRTYEITAEYGDIRVSAKARMPYPVKIDSIRFERVETNDSLRTAQLFYTVPDGDSYFYVTMRDGIKARPYPSLLAISEGGRPGESKGIPLMKPKIKIDSVKYAPHFKVGEELEITLNRVDRDAYEFWKEYSNYILVGTSPFIGGDKGLHGNVSGGFGIWSVQGVDKKFIIVK